MDKYFEKIASEAFQDELQKIAGAAYVKDTMPAKKRLKLFHEASSKGQPGVAQYNMLAAITRKVAPTPADSADIVRGYGAKLKTKKARF